MRNKLKIFFVLLCVIICGNIYAQDFGFDNDDGDSGGNGSALTVTVGGEVSVSPLGYFDDIYKGADHTNLGDIFSGKLNFSAGTSFADGVINLKIQATEQPVSVDEAYVRAYFGALEIEGGLRKLTWGKADSFGPLDVINPLDYTELTDLSDIINLKIARPLIHASYRIGSFSKIEGVFVPSFEPLRYASKGDRWEPAQMKKLSNLQGQIQNQIQTQIYEQLQPIEQILQMNGIPLPTVTVNTPSEYKPDDISTLLYAQAGARFTTTIGPADIGLQYYYGRLTRPAVTSTITSTTTYIPVSLPPPLPSQLPSAISADVDLNYAYNPYHQIGIDWAQVLFGFNIRAEFAANITEDLDGDDGAVYNPSLLWSFGFDRDLFWGINLNFQCNESIRLMDDKIGNKTLDDGVFTKIITDTEENTDKIATQIIAALSKKFFRDELELRFAALWEIEANDYLLMPAIIWTRDTVSVELSGGIFGGDEDGQFGQYYKNNFVKVSLTYSF
ncbi:hypothetical protein [Treponema sp. R80B11-R83G3]